jgi:sulfur carrier protein
MKLLINGSPEDVSGTLTIQELLAEKKVEDPDIVTVELNGIILRREDFVSVKVEKGDAVEFLYFMGGGSEQFLSALKTSTTCVKTSGRLCKD